MPLPLNISMINIALLLSILTNLILILLLTSPSTTNTTLTTITNTTTTTTTITNTTTTTTTTTTSRTSQFSLFPKHKQNTILTTTDKPNLNDTAIQLHYPSRGQRRAARPSLRNRKMMGHCPLSPEFKHTSLLAIYHTHPKQWKIKKEKTNTTTAITLYYPRSNVNMAPIYGRAPLKHRKPGNSTLSPIQLSASQLHGDNDNEDDGDHAYLRALKVLAGFLIVLFANHGLKEEHFELFLLIWVSSWTISTTLFSFLFWVIVNVVSSLLTSVGAMVVFGFLGVMLLITLPLSVGGLP